MRRGIRVLLMLGAIAAMMARTDGSPEPVASAAPREDSSNSMPSVESEAAALEEPAPADSESLHTQARTTQARAARMFRDGHYAEAAALLQQAYRADPRPIFLFNAAQSYRIAQQPAEARGLYEQFLSAAPTHTLAQEARAYLKDMEALLSMQRRTREVALALEEQLSATESGKQQALAALEQERLRAQQIEQSLLSTKAQLDRDRQKLVARKRWILGLSVGVPLLLGGLVGGSIGVVMYTRSHTDGGTAVISR